jgi:outer membrane protein TolC
MKTIKLILLLVLMSGVARAADLAELQEQALANREVIQRYAANLEKSRTNETLARSGFYPALDVGYTANWLDEPTVFEDRESRFASGTVSWNVFAGLRDKYNLQSAAQLSQAEAYRLRGLKQDIKLAVALRYLAIYDRQASLVVAEDAAATLNKLAEDAVNRLAVGLIRKSEMLKFKVDLDNAIIARKKARAELDKSLALLQREIGREVEPAGLRFREFADPPPGLDQAEYEAAMLAQRSELKYLEEIAGAAALRVKVERARYYPSVNLAGIYRKYDDPVNAAGADDDELRAQLSLSINLFDGFGKKARIGAATLEEQGLRYDLAEARRDFTVQLQNLFLDYRVNGDNVAVAAGSIAQAEENLRVNRLSYEEGATRESEVLDAIANLSRARFNFVAAKSEGFANYFQIVRAAEGL